MAHAARHPDGGAPRPRLAARLRQRAARAKLELPPALAARLCAYVELLQQWNRRMNLTALDDGNHGLDRLVIEPLAAAAHAAGTGPRTIIDIGSGSGSPAIPLRLALGGGPLLMVESRTRKAAFLREAARRLELGQATVETARFEDLAAQEPLHGAFDLLTLRGVRAGARELQQLGRFVRPGGELFLFRGPASASAVGGGGDADDPPAALPPSLAPRGTFPLIDSLGSRLLVLRKDLA